MRGLCLVQKGHRGPIPRSSRLEQWCQFQQRYLRYNLCRTCELVEVPCALSPVRAQVSAVAPGQTAAVLPTRRARLAVCGDMIERIIPNMRSQFILFCRDGPEWARQMRGLCLVQKGPRGPTPLSSKLVVNFKLQTGYQTRFGPWRPIVELLDKNRSMGLLTF